MNNNKRGPELLWIPVVLLVVGLAIYTVSKPSQDDAAHLVSVATDAMIANGHGGFLRGGGMNVSQSGPYATKSGADKAVVTILYQSNLAPVSDPTVNLVRDPKTGEWVATSFTDGGGVLHPITWHPQ